MAFWSDRTIEPKRGFRFLMDIGAKDTDTIASYFIKEVKKPNFTMDGAQEVRYIGHTFKYPGRVKWEDITVTVIDPGSPDATAIMMNIINNSGYSLPRAVSGEDLTRQKLETTISKAKSYDALGAIRFSQIDDTGRSIETWTLHNSFLQSVDFGTISYENDEVVNYTLTITYDYASLGDTSTKVNAGMRSKATKSEAAAAGAAMGELWD